MMRKRFKSFMRLVNKKNKKRILLAIAAILFVVSLIFSPSILVGLSALFFVMATMDQHTDKENDA